MRRFGWAALLLLLASCKDIPLEGATCLPDDTCGESGLFCVDEGGTKVCRASPGAPADGGSGSDAGTDGGVDAGPPPLPACDGGHFDCALSLTDAGFFPAQERWINARLAVGKFTGGQTELAILTGDDDSIEVIRHLSSGGYARTWVSDGGYTGTAERLIAPIRGVFGDGLIVQRRSGDATVFKPNYDVMATVPASIWISATPILGDARALSLDSSGRLHVFSGVSTSSPQNSQLSVGTGYSRVQGWGDLAVVQTTGNAVEVHGLVDGGTVDAGSAIQGPMESPLELTIPGDSASSIAFHNAAGTLLLRPGPTVATLQTTSSADLSDGFIPNGFAAGKFSDGADGLLLLMPNGPPRLFSLSACSTAVCQLPTVPWNHVQATFSSAAWADLDGDGIEDLALVDGLGRLWILIPK